MTFSARSATVEMDGREKVRVEGRESPGKDERRIFTLSAMLNEDIKSFRHKYRRQ